MIDATIDLHKMTPTLSEFDHCVIANCSHSVLSSISSIYYPIRLHNLFLERHNDGVFSAYIGSTTFGSLSNYVSEVTTVDSDDESESEPDDDDDATLTDWYLSLIDNFDEYWYDMIADISAAIASRSTGVTADHLSKVWMINAKTSERTLDVTIQLLCCSEDPTLSRNYSTGDPTLRYKRIDQYFVINTFFFYKKEGKSSRGYTCMQFFVTDKVFFHVIPMKSKSEVPLALKMFAKDIGASDAIICDVS